jgi:hypothetical protein
MWPGSWSVGEWPLALAREIDAAFRVANRGAEVFAGCITNEIARNALGASHYLPGSY